MKLLIVESPSKAKTIEKYLDGAFTVRASVGHIRDLPKSNKDAIDIPGGFIPKYEISKGKEEMDLIFDDKGNFYGDAGLINLELSGGQRITVNTPGTIAFFGMKEGE